MTMARVMSAFKSAGPAALLLAAIAALPAQAQAPQSKPSRATGFPIGTSGSACEAVGVTMGAARQSIFDRKWAILCSDVSRPVGPAFALRDAEDASARAAKGREEALECTAAGTEPVESAGSAALSTCHGLETGLAWRQYSLPGGTLYLVEGLAAYDSALRLALANLVAGRVLQGEVSIANLVARQSTSIIRAKAAVADIDTLFGRGYRGNSAGAYAQAAELFTAAPDCITQPDRLRALIDEPVNGVGKGDLWQGCCRGESGPCSDGGSGP